MFKLQSLDQVRFLHRFLVRSGSKMKCLLSTKTSVRCVVTEGAMVNMSFDLEGTPYEGGQFRMKIVLGESFPSQPPKGFFLTKIFHPNVAKNGAICVNTLKRDWKPEMGIEHVLTVCKCLLIHPNPASALNEGVLRFVHFNPFTLTLVVLTNIFRLSHAHLLFSVPCSCCQSVAHDYIRSPCTA